MTTYPLVVVIWWKKTNELNLMRFKAYVMMKSLGPLKLTMSDEVLENLTTSCGRTLPAESAYEQGQSLQNFHRQNHMQKFCQNTENK